MIDQSFGPLPRSTSFEMMSRASAASLPSASSQMARIMGSMPDETRMSGIGGDWARHQSEKVTKPGSSLISTQENTCRGRVQYMG